MNVPRATANRINREEVEVSRPTDALEARNAAETPSQRSSDWAQ